MMRSPQRHRIFAVAGALAIAALIVTLSGCATSGPTEGSEALAATSSETAALQPEAASPATPGEAPAASAEELAERWGIELVGVRLTAADYMLDVRYKVLDPDKAVPLFTRANKAFLIHPASGAEIPVYSPAKVGPLRSTNAPEQGRIYFIFFSNPQGRVHRGDPVTFKIGDFEAAATVE